MGLCANYQSGVCGFSTLQDKLSDIRPDSEGFAEPSFQFEPGIPDFNYRLDLVVSFAGESFFSEHLFGQAFILGLDVDSF